MDELEIKHACFLPKAHTSSRRPAAEYLYFALLLRAIRRGTLDHEAEMLRITKQLAEAQVRRFQLLSIRKQRRVERVISDYLPVSSVDQVREVALLYRFTLIGTIGR